MVASSTAEALQPGADGSNPAATTAGSITVTVPLCVFPPGAARKGKIPLQASELCPSSKIQEQSGFEMVVPAPPIAVTSKPTFSVQSGLRRAVAVVDLNTIASAGADALQSGRSV